MAVMLKGAVQGGQSVREILSYSRLSRSQCHSNVLVGAMAGVLLLLLVCPYAVSIQAVPTHWGPLMGKLCRYVVLPCVHCVVC